MLTGLERCEVLDCRFNKRCDCVLKTVTIDELGSCAFLDITEKKKSREYIDSNECDTVEMLSEREEWISTQFKFLKRGFTIRVFKNEDLVIVNDESEFITTSDAYEFDSNYRVNIYVDA